MWILRVHNKFQYFKKTFFHRSFATFTLHQVQMRRSSPQNKIQLLLFICSDNNSHIWSLEDDVRVHLPGVAGGDNRSLQTLSSRTNGTGQGIFIA